MSSNNQLQIEEEMKDDGQIAQMNHVRKDEMSNSIPSITLESLTSGDELQSARELANRCPGTSASKIIRFLRARKGNVDAATEMLSKHLEWYKTASKVEIDDDVRKEISKGKYAFHKKDPQGRRVVVCRVRLMGKHTYESLDIVEKSLIILAEKLDEILEPLEKIVVLFSRAGHKRENTDLEWVKLCGSLFNSHYPERLHKAIVSPVNFLFRGIWNIAQYFFDPDTRAKVVLAPDQKIFQEYVDSSNIPVELGGEDTDPIKVDDLLNR